MMVDTGTIRATLVREGLVDFKTAGLAEADLAEMDWAGDALHLEIMRRQMMDENQDSHILGVYAPGGSAVSKGYVVHNHDAGESTISQLATHPDLQSLGLGRYLIGAIEDRIREQNIGRAVLGVETRNPRALSLYESLGYTQYKTALDSWEAARPDGSTYTHETTVNWLAKLL